MSARHPIDVALCEELALRASSGDVAAWKALIEHVWPPLRALVENSRSMGSFARSEDHVHDVLARIVDRLGRRGGRGLGLYPSWHAQNPDKAFDELGSNRNGQRDPPSHARTARKAGPDGSREAAEREARAERDRDVAGD